MEAIKERLADLRRQVSNLPRRPGVYLFLGGDGRVLYVGKAKRLRSRVASYFHRSSRLARERSPAIQRMVERDASRILHVPCRSELEAARRESRLIKDLKPRCNVALKRDRRYWYVQLTVEPFPQMALTREPLPMGVRLYGPVIPGFDPEPALSALGRAFGLRTCDLPMPNSRLRPCLRRELGQCSGPCSGQVAPAQYAAQVNRLRGFLRARSKTLKGLRESMEEASGRMQFERAAALRDDLAVLDHLRVRRRDKDCLPHLPPAIDHRRALVQFTGLLGLHRTIRSILCIGLIPQGSGPPLGLAATYIDGRAYRPLFRLQELPGGDASEALVTYVRQLLAQSHPLLRPEVLFRIDSGQAVVLTTDPPATLASEDSIRVEPEGFRVRGGSREVTIPLHRHRQAWLLIHTMDQECSRIGRLLTSPSPSAAIRKGLLARSL